MTLLLFLVSFGISFGGAGLWPGFGETMHEKGYFRALEFPRAWVREVRFALDMYNPKAAGEQVRQLAG